MPKQLSALAADFAPFQPQFPDTSTRPLCPYFATGVCSFGQNCRNRHEMPESRDVEEDEDEDENETGPVFGAMSTSPEIDRTDSHLYEQRELSSATVTFTDGAQVSKIVLPSETSSIQIFNLPVNAEPRWIIDLLGSLGFIVNTSHTKISISSRTSTSIATVRFDKPETGKLVVDRFNNTADPGDIGDVSIKEIQPLTDSGKWLETGSIICSWQRPTRSAKLTYSNSLEMRLAAIHFSRLDHSFFQLSGNPINSFARPADHESGSFKPQLELFGLDEDVTAFEIELSLRPFHCPQKIRIREPSLTLNPEESLEIIEELLKDVGHLQSFQHSSAESNGKQTARATYLDSKNAPRAVQILHKSRHDGIGRLSLKHVSTMKFKILTKISNAIKAQLNYIVESNAGALLMQIKKLETSSSIVRFSSFGEQGMKILADAKIMVERLLAGTPIVVEGKALWHSFFQGPTALSYLASLSRANDLYIHRDDRKRQLVFYGGMSAPRHFAQRSLIAKVQSLTKPKYNIVLSKDQVTILLYGGMSQVQSILGDKVSLDIKSRALTINGSEEDLRIARAIVLGEDAEDEEQPKPNIGDCVTCWSQNEDSIVLKCGHTYCKQCLKAQASVAGEREKEIPLRCQGDGSKCQQSITLNELHNELPLVDYENLLNVSFLSYVRARPSEYQYCPTPDCTSIYRPSNLNTNTVFRCNQCLLPICTSCRTISHPGLSCFAHQQRLAADVDFQTYLNDPANETKVCPKCETNIEKIEGCNHMTCRGCNAHICWVCREAFVDGPNGEGGARACENHLTSVHGGLFDDVGSDEDDEDDESSDEDEDE